MGPDPGSILPSHLALSMFYPLSEPVSLSVTESWDWEGSVKDLAWDKHIVSEAIVFVVVVL